MRHGANGVIGHKNGRAALTMPETTLVSARSAGKENGLRMWMWLGSEVVGRCYYVEHEINR